MNAHSEAENTKIDSVGVSNFKMISEAAIPLDRITYLVGGNNSGKSSILQAIHTSFSCAQLYITEGANNTSIPEADLFYSPTENFTKLGHGKAYTSRGKKGKVSFSYQDLSDPSITSEYSIHMGKANNRNNIKVSLNGGEDNPIYRSISANTTLFSVYVPGLTGIPIREEYKSRGAILRTAASGEANLVFRSILLHLKGEGHIDKLERILGHLMDVEVKFQVDFDESTDQYITVLLRIGNTPEIPIDLWGTGVLQVTQIIAYALLFRPTLLLIDEPDSHLHPSLQNTLSEAFNEIVNEVGCQIIITTHSRHMIASAPEGTRVVWMRNGEVASPDARELSEILLDLGALDSFDEDARIIVYTEDENESALTQCIKSISDLPRTSILSYKGVRNAPKVAQMQELIKALNKKAVIVIHRDRDCLTDEEIEIWAKEYRDAGMHVFVPLLTDTESYYCLPSHLSNALGINEPEAESIVNQCLADNQESLREKFDAKRQEANTSAYYPRGGSPNSDELWEKWNRGKFKQNIHGKALLGHIDAQLKRTRFKDHRNKIRTTLNRDLLIEVEDFFNPLT